MNSYNIYFMSTSSGSCFWTVTYLTPDYQGENEGENEEEYKRECIVDEKNRKFSKIPCECRHCEEPEATRQFGLIKMYSIHGVIEMLRNFSITPCSSNSS